MSKRLVTWCCNAEKRDKESVLTNLVLKKNKLLAVKLLHILIVYISCSIRLRHRTALQATRVPQQPAADSLKPTCYIQSQLILCAFNMHFDAKRCLLSSLVQTNHNPDYHACPLSGKKILIFRLKSVTSVCAFIVFESVNNKIKWHVQGICGQYRSGWMIKWSPSCLQVRPLSYKRWAKHCKRCTKE